MNKYYVTTTLPYVNADPHIGFALEIVQGDVLARYYRSKYGSQNVFFNTGTDEHGQKIYNKALESGLDPKEYVDEYAKKFDDLKKALNLSYEKFIRTTDQEHKNAAKELWRRCRDNGYIEKGIYKAKYCVGCELEKTDSELVEGRCELHPSQEIEIIEEENYFFKFSKLEDKLLELYKNSDFVVPDNRLREIENFVRQGLKDFSISRLKSKMPWGVEVPDDEDHVMYVWFDALTNYISTLGWPDNTRGFEDYWGSKEEPRAVQLAGKDNLRQQSAMWQAMLIAAGLPTSRQIFIHGFVTADGQKMSKSLGNVINPQDLVEDYGTDATRYFLLARIHPYEDSDFTKDRFEETYTSDLSNGLGNLVSRVYAMARKEGIKYNLRNPEISSYIGDYLKEYRFDKALEMVRESVSKLDLYINENEVWAKSGEEKKNMLTKLLVQIEEVAVNLSIFIPETSSKILQSLGSGFEMESQLFPRLE